MCSAHEGSTPRYSLRVSRWRGVHVGGHDVRIVQPTQSNAKKNRLTTVTVGALYEERRGRRS